MREREEICKMKNIWQLYAWHLLLHLRFYSEARPCDSAIYGTVGSTVGSFVFYRTTLSPVFALYITTGERGKRGRGIETRPGQSRNSGFLRRRNLHVLSLPALSTIIPIPSSPLSLTRAAGGRAVWPESQYFGPLLRRFPQGWPRTLASSPAYSSHIVVTDFHLV